VGGGQRTGLGIDTKRLAVAGSSAGGALAARLAQRSADGDAPRLAFQLLHQPVLDDRSTPSSEEFDSAPARATEHADVPATLITCSELDPLRDEAVEYAVRLMRAGVATELHVFGGTCHGFDAFLPEWETSQQLYALQGAALRRALHDRKST
jgi:acetyl esterase/lipase